MHRGGARRYPIAAAALAVLALIGGAALASTGALTYKGCIANAGFLRCTARAHDSLQGARGVAVSPDGTSVYVASFFDDAITRFDRSPQ